MALKRSPHLTLHYADRQAELAVVTSKLEANHACLTWLGTEVFPQELLLKGTSPNLLFLYDSTNDILQKVPNLQNPKFLWCYSFFFYVPPECHVFFYHCIHCIAMQLSALHQPTRTGYKLLADRNHMLTTNADIWVLSLWQVVITLSVPTLHMRKLRPGDVRKAQHSEADCTDY